MRIPTLSKFTSKTVFAALPAAALLLSGTAMAVPYNITYNDGANEGFNDPSLGQMRKDALEYAVAYWANRIDGTVTVEITAEFNSQGGNSTSAPLASAGPVEMALLPTQGPRNNTYYPIALANQIDGSDLSPGTADINITFNSDVDGSTALGSTNFYYGLDEDPGSDVNAVRVALHELGHGFGFIDCIDKDTGQYTLGSGTDPCIYDTFLREGNSPGTALTSMSDGDRQNALTGENLFWEDGTNVSSSHGSQPPMYAPPSYEEGSSVSHFDEGVFTPEELMEPNLNTDLLELTLTDEALDDFGYSLLGPAELPDVNFSTTPASAEEGDPAQQFEVEISATSTEEVTMELELSGSADEGTDYTIDTTSLTISPSNTTATFSITPQTDSESESTETVNVKLTRIINAEFGGTTSASMDINDAPSEIMNWMIY